MFRVRYDVETLKSSNSELIFINFRATSPCYVALRRHLTSNGNRAASLRFRSRRIFRRINKLPDVRSLLVQISQMPFPQLLIHLNVLLGLILLPRPDIRLTQPVMRVSKIRVKLQRSLVLGNGLRKFALIRIKIAKLQVSFGKAWVGSDGSLQK